MGGNVLTSLFKPLKQKQRLFNFPRVLRDNESLLILNSFRADEQHYKLVILLEASTGFRIGDIVRLKINQFRDNYKKLIITEEKTDRPIERSIPELINN